MGTKKPYARPNFNVGAEEFYQQLIGASDGREIVQDFVIPKETGRAFEVKKGEILRVTTIEGPQVADLNAFCREDPREMFWSGRTRTFQGTHLTVGHQLWSTPSRMRPMFTIIGDTVEHKPLPKGAASHDLLYSRCNEHYYKILTGEKGRPNCQDNLANAIAEFELTPDYVHDAFNIFMTIGVDEEGRMFFLEPDAKKGDYIELYAEIDCLVAISACPGGSSGPQNRPLGVKVYRPPVG